MDADFQVNKLIQFWQDENIINKVENIQIQRNSQFEQENIFTTIDSLFSLNFDINNHIIQATFKDKQYHKFDNTLLRYLNCRINQQEFQFTLQEIKVQYEYETLKFLKTKNIILLVFFNKESNDRIEDISKASPSEIVASKEQYSKNTKITIFENKTIFETKMSTDEISFINFRNWMTFEKEVSSMLKVGCIIDNIISNECEYKVQMSHIIPFVNSFINQDSNNQQQFQFYDDVIQSIRDNEKIIKMIQQDDNLMLTNILHFKMNEILIEILVKLVQDQSELIVSNFQFDMNQSITNNIPRTINLIESRRLSKSHKQRSQKYSFAKITDRQIQSRTKLSNSQRKVIEGVSVHMNEFQQRKSQTELSKAYLQIKNGIKYTNYEFMHLNFSQLHKLLFKYTKFYFYNDFIKFMSLKMTNLFLMYLQDNNNIHFFIDLIWFEDCQMNNYTLDNQKALVVHNVSVNLIKVFFNINSKNIIRNKPSKEVSIINDILSDENILMQLNTNPCLIYLIVDLMANFLEELKGSLQWEFLIKFVTNNIANIISSSPHCKRFINQILLKFQTDEIEDLIYTLGNNINLLCINVISSESIIIILELHYHYSHFEEFLENLYFSFGDIITSSQSDHLVNYLYNSNHQQQLVDKFFNDQSEQGIQVFYQCIINKVGLNKILKLKNQNQHYLNKLEQLFKINQFNSEDEKLIFEQQRVETVI